MLEQGVNGESGRHYAGVGSTIGVIGTVARLRLTARRASIPPCGTRGLRMMSVV